MKNSFEEQFITDFCNKIKVEHASKRSIAEQVFEAGYRLEVQQPTANTDGWIEWAGGECPVDVDTRVEVQLRNPGNYHKCMPARADSWDWGNDGVDGDIIAYCLHQPQDANSRANDDRLNHHVHSGVHGHTTGKPEEADLNECIGQTPEDITLLTHFMLDEIRDSEINISLDDAYELAQHLISVGYRKQ